MQCKKMVCLGDSLTYGLGVPVEHNWVENLNRELPWQVVNRGISGDTSGGMLARLDRDVLSAGADILFLMGGSNDFIMGCDISVVKANIMSMVHQAYAAKIKVILCAEITGDTEHVRQDWSQLADFYEVDRKTAQMSEWMKAFCPAFQIPCIGLYESFAQQTAGNKSAYFFDGVHPNRQGHRLIADIIKKSIITGGNNNEDSISYGMEYL